MNDVSFQGFGIPESNYFRLPNDWTDITAGIKTIAELKIVEYVLRHTWGYKEYGVSKHITVDEFQRGRKRADGTRIDKGTGLSEQSVRNGVEAAIKSGFVQEQVDESDRARVKKSYGLKMVEGVKTLGSGVQTLAPEVQSLGGRGLSLVPRTEKDTEEKHLRKKRTYVEDPALIPFEQLNGLRAVAESLDLTEITKKDAQRLEQIVHDPECKNTVCEAIGSDYMVYVYGLPESKRPKDIISGFRWQVAKKRHWAQYQKVTSPGYTITARTSNGGSSPTEYVMWDTPITTDIPQFVAFFEAVRSTGQCETKAWKTLEGLGKQVKGDGTLLFIASDEQEKRKIERDYRRRISSGCRDAGLTFEIACGA